MVAMAMVLRDCLEVYGSVCGITFSRYWGMHCSPAAVTGPDNSAIASVAVQHPHCEEEIVCTLGHATHMEAWWWCAQRMQSASQSVRPAVIQCAYTSEIASSGVAGNMQ